MDSADTMVKSLVLNSALLNLIIQALAFSYSYASSVMRKVRNLLAFYGTHLQLRIPLKFCGTQLQLLKPEQLIILATLLSFVC